MKKKDKLGIKWGIMRYKSYFKIFNEINWEMGVNTIKWRVKYQRSLLRIKN